MFCDEMHETDSDLCKYHSAQQLCHSLLSFQLCEDANEYDLMFSTCLMPLIY